MLLAFGTLRLQRRAIESGSARGLVHILQAVVGATFREWHCKQPGAHESGFCPAPFEATKASRPCADEDTLAFVPHGMCSDGDESPADMCDGLQRISEIISLAQPSRSCDSHEVVRLARYAMAAKAFLRSAAERLLQKARGSAVMCWYSNDTTPMTTRKTFRNLVGDRMFINRARQSGEYIIQRLFVQDASGHTACVLSEPQRASDKTAATHFGTYLHLCAYPRSIMDIGILVEAHVWDGALFSACDRLHRQYMAAYHHQLGTQLDEGDAKLNEMTHWYVSTKCVLHLAHGSLKRAALDYTEDKSLLRKCWVAGVSSNILWPVGVERF